MVALEASRPPVGLPGLDPAWSRLVTAVDYAGVERTWHVLDNWPQGAQAPERTIVCVHGNPTWSYLWRSLLATAPEGVRVIAIDQLGMGFSERLSAPRTLPERVKDLESIIGQLVPSGAVTIAAHDWGGPISLGWCIDHADRVDAVVLLNTAVHQPEGSLPPSAIRLARARGLLRLGTSTTQAFIRTTTALSWPSMPRDVAHAYAAPYRGRARRSSIEDFVADIPLEEDHPSRPELERISGGLGALSAVPVIMLWGPGDPVFSDRYLADLIDRLPHADVHRYEGARHLVIEDAPALVPDLWSWLAQHGQGVAAPAPLRPSFTDGGDADAASVRRTLGANLADRATDDPHGTCLAEPSGKGFRRVSWLQMHSTVERLARGLVAQGVMPGDRVAVLVTPGADLVALVYACWRIGAVVVVTDAGLGARGIHRALRGARPDVVIAIPKAMALVRATGLPGRRIAASSLGQIASQGRGTQLPDEPASSAEALVAFTSGSTGPAKGVVYLHGQVEATRDLLGSHYGITPSDALVAAFAPWAVLGPALGIASVIPDMDVTSPRTLQATAFARATAEVGGTLAWASPAAFASILRTAGEMSAQDRASLSSLRLVLGAGAPVSRALLEGMAALCTQAQLRTPYGMTEVLPVCDVTLDEIVEAGPGPGVLVGHGLPGVSVRISEVDARGNACGPLTAQPGVMGEVVVSATHRKDRYDRLYFTEAASSRDGDWHRTGDIGELDDHGRLWIGGRLAHVITTPKGPVAPVPIEQRIEILDSVQACACVGVGPVGIQQVVAIVVPHGSIQGDLAPAPLAKDIRAVAGVPVAAVLLREDLPVDIRHNSKVDRSALAAWAAGLLAGSA